MIIFLISNFKNVNISELKKTITIYVFTTFNYRNTYSNNMKCSQYINIMLLFGYNYIKLIHYSMIYNIFYILLKFLTYFFF